MPVSLVNADKKSSPIIQKNLGIDIFCVCANTSAIIPGRKYSSLCDAPINATDSTLIGLTRKISARKKERFFLKKKVKKTKSKEEQII